MEIQLYRSHDVDNCCILVAIKRKLSLIDTHQMPRLIPKVDFIIIVELVLIIGDDPNIFVGVAGGNIVEVLN